MVKCLLSTPPDGAAGLPSQEVKRLLTTKGPGRPSRPRPRAPAPVSERSLPGREGERLLANPSLECLQLLLSGIS